MIEQGPFKAAFHTLGCKTNRYETDAVSERFRKSGFQLVDFDESADVYVLNTCTVTAEADRKSRQYLRRARTKNPKAIIVAMGCHAQLNQESQLADIVIGTQGKLTVFDQVMARLNLVQVDSKTDLDSLRTDPDRFEELGPVSHQSESRAYIKIEDGCNNFCSYCAIPLARGRVRSRDPEKVVEEAMQLAAAGYKEVVLTGTHICSYGSEAGLESDALAELACKVGQVPGICRIRFGSLEPQSITSRFVAMAATVQGLCPHFHLSLQSGSDVILKRMKRHYDSAQFREAVAMIHEQFPNAALTTDVMVGFPGEDEDMHQQSLEFIREIGFSKLHVFRYSKRAGTEAAMMPDQVQKEVSIRRSVEMQALGAQMTQAFLCGLIGKPQPVLIEQVRINKTATGYTDTYVPVIVEDAAHLVKNQLITVLPLRCEDDFLYVRHAIDVISC